MKLPRRQFLRLATGAAALPAGLPHHEASHLERLWFGAPPGDEPFEFPGNASFFIPVLFLGQLRHERSRLPI